MAITFRHDVAAGLVGSYAAGQAAGRRRRQKYIFDALQQNQRLAGIGARRAVAGGARMGAAGDQIVGFHDPLDDNEFLQPGDRRRLAAARSARERKGRLGRAIPGSSQRIPITQADIDQQRENAIRDEQREFEQGQAEIKGREDRWEEERVFNRKRLESGDYSPSQVTASQEIMRQIADQRRNQKLSPEEQQAAIDILQGRLDDIFNNPEGAPETPGNIGARIYGDAWDRDGLNKVITFNEEGIPSLMRGISPDDLSNTVRNAIGLRPLDDSEEQQKKQDAQFKARENLIKAQQELASAGGPDVELTSEERKALQDMVDLRQEQLDALTGGQDAPQDGFNVPGVAGQVPRRRVEDAGPGLGDLETQSPGLLDLELPPTTEQPVPAIADNMQGLQPGVLAGPVQEAAPQREAPKQPSEAAFDKAWKQLSPGQSMLGPDGRVWIKRRR